MSVLDNTRIRISHDGREVLNISGIDMQARMPVLYRAGDFLVFKRKGFTGWSGLGQTSYYPPDYYLVELERHPDGLRIKRVVEEHEGNSTNWRNLSKRLTDLAIELHYEKRLQQLQRALEEIATYDELEDMEESASEIGLTYLGYLEMAYENIKKIASNVTTEDNTNV